MLTKNTPLTEGLRDLIARKVIFHAIGQPGAWEYEDYQWLMGAVALEELRGGRVSCGATPPPDTETGFPPAGDTLQVYMPPEIGELRHELRRFIEATFYKLRRNAHKKAWDKVDLPKLFKLLRDEVDELEQAVAEKNSIEILLEGADISNFAMFIAAAAMEGRG